MGATPAPELHLQVPHSPPRASPVWPAIILYELQAPCRGHRSRGRISKPARLGHVPRRPASGWCGGPLIGWILLDAAGRQTARQQVSTAVTFQGYLLTLHAVSYLFLFPNPAHATPLVYGTG